MTSEEKIKLIDLAEQFERTGKKKEAMEIYSKIPVPPYLAKALKEVFGTDELKNSMVNLSEAEKFYGKGWLDK